jgi:hypothetical protein
MHRRFHCSEDNRVRFVRLSLPCRAWPIDLRAQASEQTTTAVNRQGAVLLQWKGCSPASRQPFYSQFLLCVLSKSIYPSSFFYYLGFSLTLLRDRIHTNALDGRHLQCAWEEATFRDSQVLQRLIDPSPRVSSLSDEGLPPRFETRKYNGDWQELY